MRNAPNKSIRFPRFSLKSIFAIIAGLFVVLAAYQFYNECYWAVEIRYKESFAKTLLADLRLYSKSTGQLPPATEYDDSSSPLHSWRFLAPQIVEDPDSFYKRKEGGFAGESIHLAAITGAGTAFESGKKVTIRDVDGDLILFVETRNSDHYWKKPGGDIDVCALTADQFAKLTSDRWGKPNAFVVGFADGEAWTINRQIPYLELKKFFTIGGASQYSREDVLGAFRE